MSRLVRNFWLLLALAAVGLVVAPSVHAVQTSGSIQLVPSQQNSLNPNDVFTVAVYFRNTSTTTPLLPPPPPPLPPAPSAAVLTGPVSVDYACLVDCTCSAQNTSDLSFLGCDLVGGQAIGCAAGVGGEVLINLPAGGLLLPASDAPVLLATLRFRNNVQLPLTLQPHFFRATTESCALKSCQSFLPTPTECVSCAAEGCTFVQGTSTPPPLRCPHPCVDEIIFRDAPKQDTIHVQATIKQAGYDPETDAFAVRVTKGGVVVFEYSVAAGSGEIVKTSNQKGGVYKAQGPGTQNIPGLDQILITRRAAQGIGNFCEEYYQIDVTAFGNFDIAQMVDPLIKVEFFLDGVLSGSSEDTWKLNPAGTRLTFDDFPARKSPC